MITDPLAYYARKFQKLRQGITKYGKAPHKAVLLVSILDEIERGSITSHRIPLTPELLAEFKENWALLVDTPHVSDIMLPFYHLSGEGFWKQVAKDGTEVKLIIESFRLFSEYVDYAEMDKELFNLLVKPQSRNYLKTILLNTYFPRTKQNYIANCWKAGKYLLELEESILNDKPEEYLPLKGISYEVEYYIRSNLFKRRIPQLYQNRCCITGMQVTSVHGFSMIDACHIKPIHAQGPDHIKNGIALCPNLHRAFDKGLITVNADYKVLVSPAFAEDEENDYSLKKLHGRKILLPFGEKHYPGREFLEWHGERVWKG